MITYIAFQNNKHINRQPKMYKSQKNGVIESTLRSIMQCNPMSARRDIRNVHTG